MNTTHQSFGRLNPIILFGVAIGIVMFLAASFAGHPGFGLALLGVMLSYVALLWLGRRNDIVQVLRGEPADERYQGMLQNAVAFAANVLALIAVVMFVYEIAIDGNPGPYSLMGFVFAVSMIGSLIWQRMTS